MQFNVIQLKHNNIAIIVDNDEFEKVKKKYKGFGKHITIVDYRGHEFTLKKDDIYLLEKTNE